jgi:succinyl-CoA synthetase beta subunit
MVARTPAEAAEAARQIGRPVVVKAQVLTGGRGKAGGVKPARDPAAAEEAARQILGMDIRGFRVERVLVVEAVDIATEYYAAFTVDRAARGAAFIFSRSGGVDIEEVAVREPERISTLRVAGAGGPTLEQLAGILGGAFPTRPLAEAAAAMAQKLYRLFLEKDCSLVEVNPLALTRDGALVAADAKVVLDDNGVALHPELEALRNPEEYTADEIEARKAGLSFVSLDGEIGCMVNGAGLAMATMDAIKLFGGRPANFLDVGGSSNPQKVLDAMRILLRNPKLKAILLNIFGGITRCDDIARGLLMARQELKISVPMVIRLIGTNEREGHELLRRAGLVATAGMTEAVRAVVVAAQGKGATA